MKESDVYVVINEGYYDGRSILTRWLVAVCKTFEEAASYVRCHAWTSQPEGIWANPVNVQSVFDRDESIYKVNIEYRDGDGQQFDNYEIKQASLWKLQQDFPENVDFDFRDGVSIRFKGHPIVQRGSTLWEEEL